MKDTKSEIGDWRKSSFEIMSKLIFRGGKRIKLDWSCVKGILPAFIPLIGYIEHWGETWIMSSKAKKKVLYINNYQIIRKQYQRG